MRKNETSLLTGLILTLFISLFSQEIFATSRWRVIYPAFSAPGCVYSREEENTVFETENFRFKFKAAEIWRGVKDFFSREKPEECDRT